MEDKTQILYKTLFDKGLYTKSYDEFATQFSDEVKKEKLFNSLSQKGLYTKTYEEFGTQFFPVKKKDISLDLMLSAAKGETILEDFGEPSKESITPKLPYQEKKPPKTTQEETLAEELNVSSILKAQQKLPDYLRGEQDKLEQESIQSIMDELSKLEETYKKKAETNPENHKALQKEFEKKRQDVIDLRSANIPIAVESLYKKGKDYKWLDPADVKEISRLAREIASKPTDFIKKKDELESLRNNFMSKVGTLLPEEQGAISKELGDVIAQSSILDEKGAPTVFGWKQEVLTKKKGIEASRDKLLVDNPELANINTDYKVRASEKGQEFMALARASDMFNKVLALPDDSGSFIEGFKSQGRALLTAGMSDLFEAANITKILRKQNSGEELRDSEQAMVDAYGIYQTAISTDEFGKAYTRGQGVASSVAFMESFILTGGLAGMGEKTAVKLLGNQIKNKVIQNIAKGVGSAVVRTPLLPMGATETVKRMGGTPRLDKDGQWKVDPATIEPTIQAIAKGLGSNFVNALGETAGGWLAGTGVSSFIAKNLGLNKIPKYVARVFKATGQQPFLEYPEEILTTLMETPIMGDQTLKEAFSGENLWETAVQVGLISGFFSGIALPSVVNENLKRARNKEMIDLFGKDKVAEIRDAIENNDKEAFNTALGDIENLEDNQKRQLVKYANSIAQEKGARVAQEAAKIANEEAEKETTEAPIETTDKGTAVTEVGALEVPQEVAEAKAKEDAKIEEQAPVEKTEQPTEVEEEVTEPVVAEIENVKVYHTKDEIENKLSFGQEDPHVGFIKDGKSTGYRGRKLEQNEVPDRLYHITTSLGAVNKSGKLVAGEKGGLGGGQMKGVSFTSDKNIADRMVSVMKQAIRFMSAKTEAEAKQILGEIINEDNALAGTKLSLESQLKYFDTRRGLKEPLDDTKDMVLKSYLQEAERASDKLINPILFDAINLKGKDVNDVGVIEVSKSAIPEGAAVVEGTDKFLSEIRVLSEVPLSPQEQIETKPKEETQDARKEEEKNISITKEVLSEQKPEGEIINGVRPDGKTGVETTQEELKAKEEEVKGRLANNIEDLASRIGGIKKFEGQERADILKLLSDILSDLVTLTGLKGQQLAERFRQELKDKKISLPDDVLQEAIDSYTPKTEKEATEKPSKGITPEKGITPPPEETTPQKEAMEGEKPLKRTGFEKKETKEGVKGSIEKRKDEIGKIVKRIIDDNPHFYEATTRIEEIEKAKDLITSFASFDNALTNLLKKTKNIDDLTMRHVARQVMMQKLGEDLRDAMKTGVKADADVIADKIVNLEDILQKEGRIASTTLSMTIWQALTPEASVFMVNRVINEANRTKLGFEAQQAEDFINKWNEEVPESVKRLLTENPELRDFLDKVKVKADKVPQSKRTTKAKDKELATKVRGLKSSSWGLTFADPIGATVILDRALEVTARTIETTGNILQSIQDGITEVRKSDWYKSLTSARQKEVDKTYSDKVRKEVEFDAAEYIEGQSWYSEATQPEKVKEEKAEATAQQERVKADKRLKEHIFDVIASHWLVEKATEESLVDKLVDEVGLTKKEAEQIAKISEEAVRRDSRKVFEATLGKKIINTNTRKSAFEKFFNLIKRGVLTNENYYEVFAEKHKLRQGLTEEEKVKLQKLAVNAQTMAPYGYLGDLVFNEFLQYMAQVTVQDSWIGKHSKLMSAANYSRILSGLTTHKVNLTSAGANILITPFLGTLNPLKWGNVLVKIAQGDMKGAHIANPLARLSYAIQVYKIGAEIGGTTALNIVKHGNIKEASKYMESVNNLSGQKIPVLEKNNFGVGKAFRPWLRYKFKLFGKTYETDVNPQNAMKYSGRTLLAEDAAMFNLPFAAELAETARRKLIRKGEFKSLSDLKEKILNEIAGRNLTEEQAKNIEQQLEEQVQMLRATGIEPTPMQIKQRRFELTRTLLELTPEEIEDATQVARVAIFTNESAGIFSIIGDAMGRFFGKHIAIKLASQPLIPFTGVLGRIADMGLDGMLGYGIVRAKGWSPTSIIARIRQAERTGQLKDFWTSPAKAGLFGSAQLGAKGSRLYENQMARGYFGLTTIATIASIFLTSDDDKKDKDGHPILDITGGLHYHDWNEKEGHYMGAYTLKVGPFRLRYLNYPIINTAFAIVGNYKDALNAGEVNDDFMARLSLLGKAWFQSLALIKDTWLAKGINDIFEMIGGLIASFGGDEQGRKRLKDDGEIIELDKRITRQLENARDNYTGLLIKYIDPLKSNYLQQAMKFTTPESRLKGTGLQLWAYNVGLQWWNDKRTDVFGQTVTTLPGDQGTAWPREKDERWEKMWKYNIHIQDVSAKEKLVIKGVPQTLEWEQYIERKGLIQDLFKDRFDEYFRTTPQKELDKKAETYKVDPLSGNKTNMVDNDIRKIWSDTKSDVKKYMFVWDDYVEKNKSLMTTLMEEGVLPDFYKPQLEDENGEKIIIPFDKLLELNKNIMDIFLPDAKEYLGSLSEADLKAEKEDKDDNGVSRFEDYLKWYWDRARDEAVSDLENELMKW